MACTFDKEKLADYFDGEATLDERSKVEAHIAGCSDCLRDLGDLKATSGMVKSLKRVSAPPAILKGIETEIVRPAPPSFRQARTWMQWGVSVAAVGLICASIVIISRRSTDPVGQEHLAAAPKAASEGRVAKPQDRPAEPESKKFPADHNESADGKQWDRRDEESEKSKEMRQQPKVTEAVEPPTAALPTPKEAKGGPVLKKETEHAEGDDSLGLGGGYRGDDLKKKSDAPADPADKAKPVEVLALSSKDIAATRAGIEKLMEELHRKITVGAPSVGAQPYVKDHYVEVELTDAEYDALIKDLEKSKATVQKTDSEAEAKLVADQNEFSARGGGRMERPQAAEEKRAKSPKKDEGKSDAGPAPAAAPSKPMAESTEGGGAKDVEVKRRKIILAFREPAPTASPASKK